MLDFNTLEIIKLSIPERDKEMFFIVISVLMLFLLLFAFSGCEEAAFLTFIFIILFTNVALDAFEDMPDRKYKVEVKNLTDEEEQLLLEEERTSDVFASIASEEIKKKSPYEVEDGKLYFSVEFNRGDREKLGHSGIKDQMCGRFEEDLLRRFGKIKINNNDSQLKK